MNGARSSASSRASTRCSSPAATRATPSPSTCEGCNDDVNKFVWSGLGWDPKREVVAILREYSRYFIGEKFTDSFAQGLLALERNWRGPLATNEGVYTTLRQFEAMDRAAAPQVH